MRKRFVATVVAVLAAVLLLAGCGGGGASGNTTLGKYKGYATTVFGESTAIDETYTSGENYVELKDGDVAVLCLDGNPTEGTYKLEGENITITIGAQDSEESYSSVGTVKDGVLSIDFLGIGIEFTFLKDGVKPPFELTSTSATSSNDSDATSSDSDASSSDSDATNSDSDATSSDSTSAENGQENTEEAATTSASEGEAAAQSTSTEGEAATE